MKKGHSILTGKVPLYVYDFRMEPESVKPEHTFLETDLQKSIDFLLNPFFVFRNDLYVNLLHYMYTCCYTKMNKSLN